MKTIIQGLNMPQSNKSVDARLKRIFSKIGVPEKTEFVPDRFQLDALSAIKEKDCLVCAPTGSGKTWIAQEAIAPLYFENKRGWYASPLKALSNAKYAEFKDRFGKESVGILTGDRKENTDARIIVGTTEILRNHLYDTMHEGSDFPADLIVLDEVHFLGDPDRGVVWEEVIIYLPPRVRLLMLSATIANATQVAGWVQSIRGHSCAVVIEEKRPVPLYPLLLDPRRGGVTLLGQKGVVDVKAVRGVRGKRNIFQIGEIVSVLRKHHLLPAIFFLKSRTDCNTALDYCNKGRDGEETQARLEARADALLEQYPFLKRHKQLSYIYKVRAAAHHGGQLPVWKLFVEKLMTDGLLDAVFATSTVAAGVNFPARSVVLFNSDRFNGHEFVPLDATEFHQMTGRAGRRGKDNVGFMLAVPGKFMDIKLIQRLLRSPAESIESQIRINFSMTLNLLLSHTPEEVKSIFEKSFASYCAEQQYMQIEERVRLWDEFQQHLEFLKQEGFVDSDDRLTGDGKWAARLRLDQPLLIAQALRVGAFPEDNPVLLAAMVAPFIFDREIDAIIDRSYFPKRLAKAYNVMYKALSPLVKKQKSCGFKVSQIAVWPSAVMYAWASGNDWDDVLKIFAVSEGDLSMLIIRSADHLRQIASLEDIYPGVGQCARRAVVAILREPVLMV
ncbi:MAG: DEAD/DEAH box helicase [Pseudomonadota bacterium]